jgi:hypothetical protein
MTGEGKPRKQAKKTWLVVVESDGLLQKLYGGPDRSKAESAAEKELHGAKAGKAVIVMRVSRTVVLTVEDLEPKLRKGL